MTDNRWGHDGSVDPPWSVDLLADLHAGVLEPEVAAQLWPRVTADPESKAIIDALEATTADLRALADLPPVPMPAAFAARLDAALAAESQSTGRPAAVATAPPPPLSDPHPRQTSQQTDQQGQAQVIDLAAARRRRNRIVGWGSGLLAAAAAAVAVVVAIVPANNPPTGGQAFPAPPGAGSKAGPLAFNANELGNQQLDAAKGANDYGPFADKQKRADCFAANGIATTADPLGARQVTVDGKQGTLFVLATSQLGEFRLIAVEPTCGPGNPAKLADKTTK